MKKLELFWKEMNEMFADETNRIDTESVEGISLIFKKEEKRKKIYSLGIVLLILITLLSFLFIFDTKIIFNLTQKTGIVLIALGCIIMLYFAQLTKMPTVDVISYQHSSTEFLSLIKTKLHARKRFFTLGICVQFVLLILGLHFLIFENFDSKYIGGFIGLYYGFMLALAGFGIGICISIYNAYYKPIIKKIQIFLDS